MTELTAEEQKFFDTGGETEITPEVKDEEVKQPEPVKAEEPKHEEKSEKVVPYGALHEERQLRKQAQEQLREYGEKLKTFESLQKELNDWRSEKQRQKETEEAQQDPNAYVAKKVDEVIQWKNQFEQTQQQTSEQQRQQNEFLKVVNSHVMAYTQEQPDYPKALQYLVDHRIKEYEALGISDPAERQALFDNEAVNIAQHALARGINPAQAVWNMAQVRGFQVKEPETKISATEAKLATIAKGQQSAKSVGASGSAPESELSLSDIEKMSDDEFDKLWSQMAKNQ